MNKRLPLLLSLLGVILLAASLAYWVLQLYQPPQRPLAAAPVAAAPDPAIDAAVTLFGGQVAVATATNYQLTGIVSAGRDSVAILVADNAPPKALKLGKELSPGISLAEVHPRYVMLSDSGVMKRVDLVTDGKAAASMSAPGGPPQGGAQQQATPQPMTPSGTPMPVNPNQTQGAEPPMAPGAVQQAPQQQPQAQQQQQQQPQPQQSQFTPPGNVGPRDAPQQPGAGGNQAPVQMPAPTHPTTPVNQ
jgi:general secretion pathway protein C